MCIFTIAFQTRSFTLEIYPFAIILFVFVILNFYSFRKLYISFVTLEYLKFSLEAVVCVISVEPLLAMLLCDN